MVPILQETSTTLGPNTEQATTGAATATTVATATSTTASSATLALSTEQATTAAAATITITTTSLALSMDPATTPAATTAAASTTLALRGGAELIKGISYGPVPLRSMEGASSLPSDDWFCNEAVPMWGRSGRGDLRVMKQLGANMVRLYGNNPENDHTNFLDEAHEEGLSVAVGMSDWPYYQKRPGNCLDTELNCFTQIQPLYLENLRKGFLRPDGTYHPSLKYMNILNEPDLKVPADTDTGGPEGPVKMARAMISAFDAMLDAEIEAGVTGPLINFTATFSFAICSACSLFKGTPALGQMAQLHDAMHHPENYGYTPKHDILAAYNARFTHSFNTQSPASAIQYQFLPSYAEYFTSTPVYIGEYHRVFANQVEDVGLALSLAQQNPLFLGISFFQYQVAYWKAGSEREFGMFAFGSSSLTSMEYFGKTFDVYCLEPQPDGASGMVMPSALSTAYGGTGVNYSALCLRSPEAVALDASGFSEIAAQHSVPQMAGFVERLIHRMGATVSPGAEGSLHSLAQVFVDNGSFEDLASEVASRPSWIDFDAHANCVADRGVPPSTVQQAVDQVCSQATSFSCEDIPEQCAGNIYRLADYVFSRYYKEMGATKPLVDCSFQGAAVYASSEVYGRWTGSWQCVDEGVMAPDTQESRTTLGPSTEQATTGAATAIVMSTTSLGFASSSTAASTATMNSSALSTGASTTDEPTWHFSTMQPGRHSDMKPGGHFLERSASRSMALLWLPLAVMLSHTLLLATELGM